MTTENSQPTADKALQSTFNVWQSMKAKFMDVIILVRKEDNYYTFDSDAVIVSKLMEIELLENTTAKPICNIPHYCSDKLLQNIVKGGYRIALCDPLSSFKK